MCYTESVESLYNAWISVFPSQATKKEPEDESCDGDKDNQEGESIGGFCISEILVSYFWWFECQNNHNSYYEEKVEEKKDNPDGSILTFTITMVN